mmetsp:Transcript_6642/g.14501  ORF Transcript_6642/g.14501 Transcript_6642/m.14501 type:complete len:197 (+) Transcript_6642:212-802(+)
MGDKNYVHNDEIWRQRMKNEADSAVQWNQNWGFLAGKEQSEPRGFSTNVAKYATTGGKWTVKTVRVADDTEAGVSAAVSEQEARQQMSSLNHTSRPAAPVKRVEAKGKVLVHDEHSGVQSREAAEALRAHTMQTLGDACRTDGVDPQLKYKAPVCDSHEYGWRVPTKDNERQSLELFGVAEHGRKDMRKGLHNMVP